MVPKSRLILPFLGAYRGKSGKAVYVVMPRLRADVRAAVKAVGDKANVKLALAEMAYSVKLMHDFGVVHRDIELLNLFVGSNGHIILADFDGVSDKTLWFDSVPTSSFTPKASSP